MDVLENNGTLLQSWRIVKSPPLSGEENMRYDANLLNGVERGTLPPTFRFFRFNEPTVSYGRLQKLKDISILVPESWATIQRPTGGGIVFHQNDLCISLSWARGQAPMPAKPQHIYRWIHAVIQKSFDDDITMAACADVCQEKQPFARKECFKEPVGYDLLRGTRKVVGGALSCRRNAFLYQGSIQIPASRDLVEKLTRVFEHTLQPPHA